MKRIYGLVTFHELVPREERQIFEPRSRKPLDSFYYLPLVRALSSFASVSLPDRWWYVWRNVIKFNILPVENIIVNLSYFCNCISFPLKCHFEHWSISRALVFEVFKFSSREEIVEIRINIFFTILIFRGNYKRTRGGKKFKIELSRF